MSLGFQNILQFFVVVDLSIGNKMDGIIFIGHRLMTTININNAESGMSDSNTVVYKDSIIIRSTVSKSITHAD